MPLARRRCLLAALASAALWGCGREEPPPEPFDPAGGRFVPPGEMLESGNAAEPAADPG